MSFIPYVLEETIIFNRAWWVHAPYAHPVWSNYVALLLDLTTPGERPAVIYKEGVTHEFQLWALDPKNDHHSVYPPRMLSPPNHIYQFTAESDETAEARIVKLLTDISTGVLNPDVDFVRQWDQVFADGVSLRKGRSG